MRESNQSRMKLPKEVQLQDPEVSHKKLLHSGKPVTSPSTTLRTGTERTHSTRLRVRPEPVEGRSRSARNQTGKIIAVSISQKKGIKKINMPEVELKENFGIVDDAHAGSSREVSLLAMESIEKMRSKGLNVKPGDFAENITTEGIDLLSLEIGTKLRIGKDTIIEITQFGKECHTRCNIYYQAGDCVMPKEGIFAKVIKGGVIKPADTLEVEDAKRTK